MIVELDPRVRALKQRAHGQWTPLLLGIGVSSDILNGKNQPCPMCGGTDRFQYTDKYGEGNYICRSCGSGGGLKLAMGVLGLRFPEVLERLESQLNVPRPAPAPTAPGGERDMREVATRIWKDAQPVRSGDEVDRYLRARGLDLQVYPESLRFHPALAYFERVAGQSRSVKVGEFAAMVALVQAADGSTLTLHRTYLANGRKAFGGQSRKLLSSGYYGGAVRLEPVKRSLALCEGIETGLAVWLSTGIPVWAALNHGNLERVEIPVDVDTLAIYADNDADGEFAGQASAYLLAQRLVRLARRENRPLSVQVHAPRRAGMDWLDVYVESKTLAP